MAMDGTEAEFRGGGRGGWSSFLHWVARLFVIAAATMGLAYYWPLYRAHRVLTITQATTRDQVHTLEERLSRTTAELASTRAARDALVAAQEATNAKQRRDADGRERALARARAKLKPFLDKKALTVQLRGDDIVVSYGANAVGDAAPPAVVAARLGLCDAVSPGVSGNEHGVVEVVAYAGGAAEATAGAKPSATWSEPSQRAARIAEVLESTCHVSPSSTELTVRHTATEGATLEVVLKRGALNAT